MTGDDVAAWRSAQTADGLAPVETPVGAATEEALRAANHELALAAQRMRAVLDTAQDAYVSTDAAGTVTAWNGAAERLFGFARADALGRPVAELIIPPRLRDSHEAGLRRIRSGEPPRLAGQRLQLQAVDATGHEFPIEMTLQVIHEDGRPAFHAFLHDISYRVTAQRQLENEQTFLQALLDSLDTGVSACDRDGTVVIRNRSLRRLFELAPGTQVGGLDTGNRFFGPDGRTPLAEDEIPLTRAFAGERVDGQIVTILTADGRRHRFVSNGQPITTAAGDRLGAVVAIHDVTDQHRSQVLRETQLAVAAALAEAGSAEAAADATIAAVAGALDWAYGEFWRTEPDEELVTRIASWTRPGLDLGEFGRGEQIAFKRGEGLAGIVWETEAGLWIPEVAADPRTVGRREQARRAGLHTAIGVPVRSDGHTLGVLLFFGTTADEPDTDLLAMLDGVCAHLGRHLERRRAEEMSRELAAARRDFDRAIAQINDFVWTFEIMPDGTARGVYANPDSSGVFGGRLSAGTDLVTAMADHVHPDDEAKMAALRRTVVGGSPAETEIRVHGLDGRTRWVWVRSAPRRDGGRFFVDGIATDVTDRHELTEHRERLLADQRRQNSRLRDLDRLKDELVALVSHELRNPLGTITAYTEMLLDDPALTGDHRQLVSVIERHSGHMNGLVDDLLDLARLESGQLVIDPRPVPLARLVRETTDDRRPAAEAKQLTLAVDVPRHLPVYADPLRLRQVLDNLVSNAIKYTPSGGTITVQGRPEQDGTRPVALLDVTDSGIGIPEEQYPNLFDRFFRASNAVSQGIKGTGLGLAITKLIVDAHGGSITARPAGPGGGTTFTVMLPSTAPERT